MLIKSIAAVLLTASVTAHAGVIVGSSTLLNDVGLSQLETWLGQGPLTFTNIFTKSVGSSSANFHAAADGKGATFVLMSASSDNGKTWKTIGGYNPRSWNSYGGYNGSTNTADWTAFVFNLTDSVKLQQTHALQTYNSINYGPTFGRGHDIYVDQSLSLGYSYGWSYGYSFAGAYDCRYISGSVCKKSLVDGSFTNGTNAYINMQIGALEVFTIADFTPPPTKGHLE